MVIIIALTSWPWHGTCYTGHAAKAKTEDVEDLTKSDSEGGDDDAAALRKKLGIPEVDPDALPSSMVTKYLILNSNLDL